MSETRYMISDASKLVDVEAHVLRYWEEELDLPIGRNEMGHRYYTEENIRLFRHIKELKDRGVQLKAVRMLLPDLEKGDTEISHLLDRADRLPLPAEGQTAAREEKMQQFQCIMSRLISEALEDHTEKMGVEIGTQVSDQVIKEMDGRTSASAVWTRRSAARRRPARSGRFSAGKRKRNGDYFDRKRDRPHRPVPFLSKNKKAEKKVQGIQVYCAAVKAFLCSSAAATKPRNSGWGRLGRDFSSGCAWVARKNG